MMAFRRASSQKRARLCCTSSVMFLAVVACVGGRKLIYNLKPIVSNTKAAWLQVTNLLTRTRRSEARHGRTL